MVHTASDCADLAWNSAEACVLLCCDVLGHVAHLEKPRAAANAMLDFVIRPAATPPTLPWAQGQGTQTHTQRRGEGSVLMCIDVLYVVCG